MRFEKNICPQKNLSFEEFALIVANTPSEDLNIHFKPQALHCDLYKFKNLYRFVNLEDFSNFHSNFFSQRFFNIERIGNCWRNLTWKSIIKAGDQRVIVSVLSEIFLFDFVWETLDQMGRHATHAKTVVHKYYSKYLALKMMEKYQVDYQTFQLAKPIWIKKLHWLFSNNEELCRMKNRESP